MHNLKTFATALAMSTIFVVVFWAQVGIMATSAAGAPGKSEPKGMALNPYQNVTLTYGPSLAEFVALAR